MANDCFACINQFTDGLVELCTNFMFDSLVSHSLNYIRDTIRLNKDTFHY